MAYATSADAVALYGTAYVAIACDRDLDGNLDTTSFDTHLQVASDQMDGYLLGRYTLPLATPPAVFKKICVDIAIYNAAPTADVQTTEIKERNKAALEYMLEIARNRIKLVTAPNTTEPNKSETPLHDTNRTLILDQGARQLTHRKLRGLL